MKRANERTIIFTTDYVNKKAGTVLTCDAIMASHAIQIGVAEIFNPTFKEEIIKPILKTIIKPIIKTKKK